MKAGQVRTMKVSVAVISYKHEDFIAQALESILSQQVDFQFEIVVGEDCSPDNTRKIIDEYQRKYPGIIRTEFPEKNGGARKNFMRTINACRGEYIALLDGDDYWTSPHKLQRQVDFLENNQDCTICSHAFRWLTPDGESKEVFPPGRKEKYTYEDLLSRYTFIHSGSSMFRRSGFKGFPEWFKDETLIIGDWPFYVMMAENGKIGYLDDVMVCYRIHEGGVWSTMGDIGQAKLNIETRELVRPHLNPVYDKYIAKYLASQYLYLSQLYRYNENWAEARKYFRKSLRTNVLTGGISHYKDLLYTMLYLWSPRYLETLKSKLLPGN